MKIEYSSIPFLPSMHNFSNAIVHIQRIQYPNVSKFHKIHTRLQDHSLLRKWSGKVNRNNVSGNLAVRINKIPRWWTNNEAGGCIIRRIRTPAAFQLWGQAIHRLFLRLSLPTSHPLSLSSPRASFHSTVQGGAFYSPRPLRSLIETRVYCGWRTARTRVWTRFFENK